MIFRVPQKKLDQQARIDRDMKAFLDAGGEVQKFGTIRSVTFGVDNRAFGRSGMDRYKRD